MQLSLCFVTKSCRESGENAPRYPCLSTRLGPTLRQLYTKGKGTSWGFEQGACMGSRISVDVAERIPSGADRGSSLYWLSFMTRFYDSLLG